MQLADLIDLELQLLRDRDLSREELRRRDRRIGLEIHAGEKVQAGDPAARRRVLHDFVRAVRDEERQESFGERTVRAYHALGLLLTLLGLISGAGTAAGVLAYDGKRPVNVVHFLAVFVGLQLLLLLLLALSSTLWKIRGRLPGLGAAYSLLRLAFDAVVRLFERRLSAERRTTLDAARGRLRASRVIYGDAERWLLISLAQRFGLSFNLGALGTCLYLVAFSDLAFAWQTTLSWSAESFHGAMKVLAAPWSWIYPDGLPSLEVVRASRYFRLDDSFGPSGAGDVALLGQWWRFLVLCLITYGLLPRLALAIFSGSRLKRALSRLRLDHAEVAALLERLVSPLVQTRAPVPESEPLSPAEPAAAAPVTGPADKVTTVILWGDVPMSPAEVGALVERRFGWQAGKLVAAGVEDTGTDAAALAAIDGKARGPIVVLAEGFEAPTREARLFLTRLRAAAGADRQIVVSLVDSEGGRFSAPAGDDLAVWERHVAGLGDPYLRVEPLVVEET